jgi:DNA repair exonuclease SbcCD ATPase subunit
MPDYEVTYTGSVTPTATKHVSSHALKMDFKGTLKLEESDGAHIDTIRREFQSQMKTRIDAQLGALNKWMAERNGEIESLNHKYSELVKKFPKNPQEAHDAGEQVKEILALAHIIDKCPEDYQKIVSDWAENCHHQQGLIAMQMAVKAARVQTFNDKAFRVHAGQAVKAILIVAGVAIGIAGLIAAAGPLAPALVIVASTGVALSGVAGIGAIAKMVHDNFNIEKRILANVQKEVDTVTAAFDSVKGSGSNLSKHLTELANLVHKRKDEITQLEHEVRKYTAMSNGYKTEIDKLNPLYDHNLIAAKKKKVADLAQKLDSLQHEIGALNTSNAEAQKLLDSLKDLGVKLENLTGAKPHTLGDSLKAHVTNVDNLVTYLGSVGSAFQIATDY